MRKANEPLLLQFIDENDAILYYTENNFELKIFVLKFIFRIF